MNTSETSTVETQGLSSPDGRIIQRWDEDVLILTLSREEKRNAVTLTMAQECRKALSEAEGAARAVVLQGSDTVFCAGADIATYAAGDQETIADLTDAANELVDQIDRCPVPVIAAVEGMALGGGMELALAADLIVASETAKFGLPELTLGLIPGWGGTQRLTNQVGTRLAKKIILLGHVLRADEAEALGLVTHTAAAGRAKDTALDIARRIAERAPLAVREANRVIGLAPNGRAEERRALDALFITDDGTEGVAAFVEKRAPKFRAS